jgi:amidohydrolase
MIDDPVYPVLENPKVDKCFGIHLWNGNHIGEAVTNIGSFSAMSDRVDITITGVGTHASTPHTGVDAVVVGC